MNRIVNVLSFGSNWKMSASRFVLLLSFTNTVLFNGALYAFLDSNLDLFSMSGILIAASVAVIVFLMNLFFISLLATVAHFSVKPLFIITSLINAVALYYLISYQVILDKTMMGNIFNTRGSESIELINSKLLVYILFFSILPSIFIFKIKVKPINRLRIVFNLFLLFVLSIFFLYVNSSSWLWIDKHAKLLGGKILPWSYLINSTRYYLDVSRTSKNQILLPDGKFSDSQKVAVVLIIGETARANNFSLYGYDRDTNPLLNAEDLLIFDKTISCTTYTTASVACMLSHDVDKSGYEPLPSYLTRIGAEVIWRTSNWGEPLIHVSKYQKTEELKKNCNGQGCEFDEVLLTGINAEIESSDKQKIFIVLHTIGSHGPSYYSRYPSEFEKFKPVCRSEELSQCTQQELINAYDNTILYTDYFLNNAIQDLKKLNMPVMLIYASDHGESLGEQGLYLHGTPFMFAPKYQKEIPFFVWRSKELITLQGVNNEDINSSGMFSHANIFHTIIGALGVTTGVYNKELDVLND
jgi:lipid A ethanolaminephosphotransferase